MSWDPKRTVSRYALDAARVTVDLAKRSKTLLVEKIDALALPKRADGCLQLFPDIKAARAAQSRFSDIGIRANILMNTKDTFGHAACQFPDDTSGDARAFGCALAAELAVRGVSFVYNASDLDIRKSDKRFYIKTAADLFSADQCVIAAGADSVRCLAQLDVRLTLNGVAGAAADFNLPTEISELPECPVMDVESRSALTVFPDRIRISGGWDLKDPRTLIDRWHVIAPELMASLGSQRSQWTGVRPVSPVGRPYISATSIPDLWINTGHGHMGWTLCAGSGELLTKMMIDRHQDRRFAFSG
jgi:glycine/D-amino acid oxidase-like deaminating enzyme